MALAMEVGLGPGDFVFDGDPATPRTEGTPTITTQFFGPCLLWPNGWMDEGATWYGSRPRPRPHCIRRGPPLRETGTEPPIFSAHVYCGHGRPPQLLLSSCLRWRRRHLGFIKCGNLRCDEDQKGQYAICVAYPSRGKNVMAVHYRAIHCRHCQ